MQRAVSIIFPHQLYRENPVLIKSREIFLVEEWLFFHQYNFHQQKLLLHRASMKFYESWLAGQNYKVAYIDSASDETDCRKLISRLAQEKITDVHIAEVCDNWLEKRLYSSCKKYKINLHVYQTPGFLNSPKDTNGFFDKKKVYFQTDFYIDQRKRRHILVQQNGTPAGGKWSFDADNRKKFPKNAEVPFIKLPFENIFITEADQFVRKHFSTNYGSISGKPLFAVTFDDAEIWLNDFLENRFDQFGVYQDAIVANENTLHHAVLTPMLNIGLLTPKQIIDTTLRYAAQHPVPINSLEGFIRQIIGWREFMRLVYEREGSRQRTLNFWNFRRKIPHSFWTGETGIYPIDCTIKKVLATGYCHHIERLMVLGNFMLLCEFDPGEVYRWFMELFIDAYDWVMVSNVYGMSQFADGGLMTTKPYISGSNYLMKMSDYPTGEWQQTWDGLFWRFLYNHKKVFLKNSRLQVLINSLDKMDPAKRNNHLLKADQYLNKLDDEMKGDM